MNCIRRGPPERVARPLRRGRRSLRAAELPLPSPATTLLRSSRASKRPRRRSRKSPMSRVAARARSRRNSAPRRPRQTRDRPADPLPVVGGNPRTPRRVVLSGFSPQFRLTGYRAERTKKRPEAPRGRRSYLPPGAGDLRTRPMGGPTGRPPCRPEDPQPHEGTTEPSARARIIVLFGEVRAEVNLRSARGGAAADGTRRRASAASTTCSRGC